MGPEIAPQTASEGDPKEPGSSSAVNAGSAPANQAANQTYTGSAPVEGNQDPAQITDKSGSEPGANEDDAKVAQRLKYMRNRAQQAEQDAAYWRGKAEAGKQPINAQPQQQSGGQLIEPDIANFDDYNAYEQALKQYQNDKDQHLIQKTAQAVTQQQEAAAINKVYQQRVSAAMAADPEFESNFQMGLKLPAHSEVVALLKESEVGPQIVARFGANPQEATRLAHMSPMAAIREIVEIERQLKPKASTATQPRVSQAPEPITPGGSRASGVNKSIDEMSAKEWAAYRNQQEYGRR